MIAAFTLPPLLSHHELHNAFPPKKYLSQITNQNEDPSYPVQNSSDPVVVIFWTKSRAKLVPVPFHIEDSEFILRAKNRCGPR